jgi:chemotaxis family two-component system response regulator PixG
MVEAMLESNALYSSSRDETTSDVNQIPYIARIREFNLSEQLGLFKRVKQSQFTGQLVVRDTQGIESMFYLYLGRIIYGTGGIHPVRRWRRYLWLYCPEIASNPQKIQRDLTAVMAEHYPISWDYELFCLWLKERKISRQQINLLVNSLIGELLFDLSQSRKVTCQLKQDKFLIDDYPLALIEADQIIEEGWKIWENWQLAQLAERSPNSALIIKNHHQLQLRTSPETYQTLNQLLNGQNSLRDLAVQLKQDVIQVTSSLMSYVQLGLLESVSISDLPIPCPGVSQFSSQVPSTKKALIACVDDSSIICQNMANIVAVAGYGFISINDGLRAIAFILERQPALIFLDAIMPNINGYEICTNLRKIPAFANTPIILLSPDITMIQRLKAKIAGCSDIIEKPIDAGKIANILTKYLK